VQRSAKATGACIAWRSFACFFCDWLVVPADFPKPGILFWDVTTFLLDHTAFKYSIDLLHEQYKDKKIDVVAGEQLEGCRSGGRS
jgi:adenine/guanine phosphoribosyltransferase-like PRPP-binding protein